jgi:hypothetical protein
MGRLHRDNDQPAVLTRYQQEWYCEGERHRDDDKPAWISVNAEGKPVLLLWFRRGKLGTWTSPVIQSC